MTNLNNKLNKIIIIIKLMLKMSKMIMKDL